MDPANLEFAFRMCRLEQKMHEAVLKIVSVWRGYKTRKSLKTLLQARKRAIALI